MAIERGDRRRARRQDRRRSRRTCATPTTPGRRSSATARRYQYSHDEPFGIAEQQYAPDVVARRASTTGRPSSAPRPQRQGAVGADPPDDPRRRGIGSVRHDATASRSCSLACRDARRAAARLTVAGSLLRARRRRGRAGWLAARAPSCATGCACRELARAPARRHARRRAPLGRARRAATASSQRERASSCITRLGRRARARAGADASSRGCSRDLVLRESAASRPRRSAYGVRRGAVAGEPQPDLVRDAPRGQARPQAAQGRASARRSGELAGPPARRRRRRRAPHEARASGSSPGPAPGSTRWPGPGALAETFTADGLRGPLGGRRSSAPGCSRDEVAQGTGREGNRVAGAARARPPHGVPQLTAPADRAPQTTAPTNEEGTD